MQMNHSNKEINARLRMMEAVSTSETSVSFYETTRRNIPEDSHPQKRINSPRKYRTRSGQAKPLDSFIEMYGANFIKWNAVERDTFEELGERLCGHGNVASVRLLAGQTELSDG
jgi:hypothetical protein